MGKTGISKEKRQYYRPQLGKVRLVLEEAVLQTCKTGNYPGGGPTSPHNNCNPPSPCYKQKPS